MSTAEIGAAPFDHADRTSPISLPVGLTKPGAEVVAAIPAPRGSGASRHARPAGYATGPMAVPDAALAAAAATNATAFAAIYRRYGDALHGFCLGMLRDPDAAADCVHDVFVTAATRLGQLREHDKLRPWLYAIARHEALRRLKHRRRERSTDELPDSAEVGEGPEHGVARRELAELVAAASGGLSDRERTVLELHYRHGLDGPALADALGVSATSANTMVGRLRTTVERSLGALLVARHHGDRCAELAVVIDGWDGRLTVLMRKRIARHVDGCVTCGEARRRLVDPRALLASAPVAVPAPSWLHDQVLGHATPLLESATPHVGGVGAATASWWPAGLGASTKTLVAALAPMAAAVIAVPAVLLGGAGATSETASPVADATGLAAGPVVGGPPSSSSRRFAVDPSTTRIAPSASVGAGPGQTAERPDQPRAGGGGLPQTPVTTPTAGAPRRNSIGIPIIPRSPDQNRRLDPVPSPGTSVTPRPTLPPVGPAVPTNPNPGNLLPEPTQGGHPRHHTRAPGN